MATAITTVTKTASLVKSTKGSDKKWSEILSMNRRHDLQLPIDIAKHNHEFKRTYNLCQRQQNQTERTWAHKHETWYHDDFVFRNHLLKQLKPITRRFKDIHSLSSDEQENTQPGFLNDEKIPVLPITKELPPLQKTKNHSTIPHFPNYDAEPFTPPKVVLSKLVCSKMLKEYEPRLYSHHHGPFLDVAQRFLKRKPELIGKSLGYNDKKKSQNQYFKTLMENEQERMRLAAIKFQKQLEDDKNQEKDSDNDTKSDNYY